MFRKAYVSMTAFYIAIIMAISLLFSAWVYEEASSEVQVVVTSRAIGELRRSLDQAPPNFDRDLQRQIDDSHVRILINIVYFNSGVLIFGGVMSYLLARRTMKPIEEAMQAQNRFTADASHELRTPLAAMKTEIEVTLRDPKAKTSELRQLLQSNLEEIDRMGRLAEGLLTLARDEEKPRAIPVQLQKVMQQVHKRLKPLADAKHITFTYQTKPMRVLADDASVQKLLGILVDNAIKYSPQNTAVQLTAQAKGNMALITVADQGPGIAVADQPHIFERFYRADTARSGAETPGGHGLGLAIAQKIATTYGGGITVQSAPGKGTTFSVRLPVLID